MRTDTVIVAATKKYIICVCIAADHNLFYFACNDTGL